MHFKMIVRQLAEGKVIIESLIKEIQVSVPQKSIMDISFSYKE